MRKSNIALGIAAALAVNGLLDPTTAAAQELRTTAPPRSAPPAKLRAPTGSVLYDQPGVAVNGAPSQNFGSAYDAYDNASADDFVVTDATGWDVSQFNFAVSVSSGGDPSSATWDINVYPDASGLPGATPACSYTALAGTLTNSNTALALTLPTPCHLDPGTYWVSQVANLEAAVGGQMYWSDVDPAIAAVNSPGVFQNPLDGFGTGCTTWAPLASCGGTSPVGGGSNNFIFQVLGSVSGTASCTAGGICLDVTVALDNGNPTQCTNNTNADVSIGDVVNFCYKITNESSMPLDYHSLMDNLDGTIFDLVNQPLASGANLQYNRYRTFGTAGTSSVTATWTAQDVPPGYTVTTTTGGPPITDRIFCDGFDGVACDNGGGGGFIDITTTGTATGLGDDGELGVTMPFSFNFYGSTTNQITIGNNGGILVGTLAGSLGFSNGTLPAASLGAAILPLWDDFAPTQGDVYYATIGTAPNRQFVVEWFDRVHYDGASNTDGATFEVIINEADSSIQFEYLDVTYTSIDDFGDSDPDDCTGGTCATIGLQQDDSTANPYSFMTAAVTDNSGLTWMQASPQIFTDTDTVDIHVGAPDIDVTPTSLAGTTPEGGTSTVQLDIANVGDRDLNWTTEEAPPAAHFPSLPNYYRGPSEAPNAAERLASATLAHATSNDKSLEGDQSWATLGAFTAPAYGIINPDNYVTFDASNPTTFTDVGTIPTAPLYKTGTFINNDFSVEYMASVSDPPASGFARVSTTDGTVTAFGGAPTVAGEAWFGLKWDSSTSTLFGAACSTAAAPTSCHLYTVDPLSGAVTQGPMVTGVDDPTNGLLLLDIAIDPSGLMYGVNYFTGELLAIDKTTGAASIIGSTGLVPAYVQSLAFDQATGTLYWAFFDGTAATMYSIDTVTATPTAVGSLPNEMFGFAIATAGGPCAQPQDLPWASLSPTSGTTLPAGTSPVTVTFDASGQTEGDVLSGTLCVNSNDPDEATVEVPVEMTVGAPVPGGIVDSGIVDIPIAGDLTGLYINWVSGCTNTSAGGETCAGASYDFNIWNSPIDFFYPGGGAPNACVDNDATGGCDVLTSGDTIGVGSTFLTSDPAADMLLDGTVLIGFSFMNEDTGEVNYGYARITTAAPNGTPAVLNQYWYDNTGADITIAP